MVTLIVRSAPGSVFNPVLPYLNNSRGEHPPSKPLVPRRVAKTALWALHILFPTAITGNPGSHPDWLTVPTTSGVFKGHLAGSSVEFLGIPYAEPPLGDLRFAAPQRLTRNGTFEASDFGSGCPAFSSPPASYPGMTPQAQDIMASFASVQGAVGPESEDCLTLNIWTKAQGVSDDSPGKACCHFHTRRQYVTNNYAPWE